MVKNYNEYLNENFWSWFGKSKVVDNEGNPLVVYHGSNVSRRFSKFNDGSPIWFSKYEGYANAFINKKGKMFNVYLKLENPIYVGDIDGIANMKKIEYLSELTGLESQFLKDLLNETGGVNLFNITNNPIFKKLMQERGYDGIEAREGRVTSYAVFSSIQIKSATDNNGEFNINSPRINEKKNYKKYLNDNFKKWFGDSKVVDNNGNPLIVYHGTNRNFDIFGNTVDGYKPAYYFTPDPKYAEYITKLNTKLTTYSIIPVYIKVDKLKKVDWVISSQNIDRYLNSYEYLNELPDGVVGIDSSSTVTTYVVFKQENIKSAIGNNGEFNPNNKNINESND